MAVPFIGRGASYRLPLRKGDLLVTRFNRTSVSSGHVDPKELVAYINRGVEVQSVDNLHAKVYVFGSTAVVASANLSSESEHRLIEAGCSIRNPRMVAACRSFVTAPAP